MCQLVWLHLENYWSSGEYSDDADGDILIFVWGKMRVPRFQRTFIFKLKALFFINESRVVDAYNCFLVGNSKEYHCCLDQVSLQCN